MDVLKEEKVRISNSSKKNDPCVVSEAQAALEKKLDGAKEIRDVAVAERVAAEKKAMQVEANQIDLQFT